MNWTATVQLIRDRVTVLGMEIVGALVLYLVGRWLISLVVNAVQRALGRQNVGNNKIFSETIQNFTANPYRRVDLTAQISGAASPEMAINRLQSRLASIVNVCKTPVPEVTILTFTAFGPVLAVRPYCHNEHYWQVYFDANMAIREVLGDAAFPSPAYPVAMAESQKVAASA